MTHSDKIGEAFRQAVRAQFPEESIESYTTVHSLACKLSESQDDETFAVLLPADEEELIDIYSMQYLFNRVPVVLVLPNRDRLVESMGYRLRPRLLCYRESNVVEVVSTLRNMVKHTQL